MKQQLVDSRRKQNAFGIDVFRYVAAILVIMIHTSPLESVNEIADFILTREVARIAVPFFFMVSGYYVAYVAYRKTVDGKQVFLRMLGKLGMMYLISSIIYLPVRFYSGYFSNGISITMILKDILFDGTFYHLWYLPAAMLGICLVYLLSRRLSIQQSLKVSVILYVVGLFGDSYYGIIEHTVVGKLYTGMFHLFSYTRNGIFFAPVFLLLGVLLREKVEKDTSQKIGFQGKGDCIILLGISFSAFILEGLLLHLFQIQRHDSMYLMLLPVMYFGYQLLLLIPSVKCKVNRKIPMVVYLVHPLMIVFVRMVAKVIHLQTILVENRFVHFLVVTILSFLAAWGLLVIFARRSQEIKMSLNHEPKINSNQKSKMNSNQKLKISTNQKPKRAWIEINLDHLTSNVKAIQSILKPRTEIMGVVKANAYGHGDVLISKHLNQLGIRAFAVATIQEAIRLRKHGIQGIILILGYTPASQCNLLEKYRLTQTVFDLEYAKELNAYGKKLSVHIKIDTGMHRLGESSHEIKHICAIFDQESLKVEGMFTHLCVADSLKTDDVAFTRKQIKEFYAVTDRLKHLGYYPGKLHIQSSYGLLNYPELECDYVRMGIAMYGVLSSKQDQTVVQLPLKPVLSVRSCIVMTKEVRKGESVGYGREFIAEKDIRIAVVAIGYADGISRRLSCGSGTVLVHGKKASIIGRVCMDQMMLDITEIPEAKAEDEVVIIGTDGKEQILTEDVAALTNTISNEVLSRLGSRLPRVVDSFDWC